MAKHCLKVNDEKAEALLITSKHLGLKVSWLVLCIGENNNVMSANDALWNIGAIIDSHASLEQHASALCCTAQFQLFSIGRICCYLTGNAAE